MSRRKKKLNPRVVIGQLERDRELNRALGNYPCRHISRHITDGIRLIKQLENENLKLKAENESLTLEGRGKESNG